MMTRSIASLLISSAIAAQAVPFEKDQFSGTTLDPKRWGKVDVEGNSKLRPVNGKLQYTVGARVLAEDGAGIDFIKVKPRTNENWETIVDVTNKAKLGYKSNVGIIVYNPTDTGDQVAFSLSGLGTGGGFTVEPYKNGKTSISNKVVKDFKVETASLKVSYRKKTRTLTFWYDTDGKKNGYAWKKLTAYRTDRDQKMGGDWGIYYGQPMGVILYGFSLGKPVGRGKMTLDNWVIQDPAKTEE